MTYRQWEKAFRKRLAGLPREERERAADYYGELYGDKRDAGVPESEIVCGFGDPKEAADRIFAEYGGTKAAGGGGEGGRAATAGDTAARAFAAVFLFVFAGLPLLAVVFALAVTAAALFLSGFAILAAGAADCLYFLVQLCINGGAAYLAHVGIGLAAAGAGALCIPLFLYCAKWLFTACGKIFVWTGRIVRGKREVR